MADHELEEKKLQWMYSQTIYQQVWYKALEDSLDSLPTAVNTDWKVLSETELEAEKENTSLVETNRYDMIFSCFARQCASMPSHPFP